ncbi:DinB family protein [Micromonospora sp. NPDC051925]|uniref:DinB family protein n=1 Tax=Micromonospora sp. NPDC051925 TaxID=3364288 RepID=UPI0037CC9C12
MGEPGDAKTVLQHYLRQTREDLIWKLDGLSEREARLPRTVTGNNLLGVVKHCLNVEAGYFGPTFGREFPTPGELIPLQAYEEDPQADWYARENETKDGLIDLYRRVGTFADQTIEQLPLDAPGRVTWWLPGRQDVTLQQIIVHVTCDLARHTGHADIMREQHDAVIGLRRENTNIPDDHDWPAYVTKLTKLADRFGQPPGQWRQPWSS